MSRSARTQVIGDVGEFGFLSRLLPRMQRDGQGVIVGPGQDCAVIRCGRRRYLFTVDALVEHVHFERRWLSARQLGRKSFLVNASDAAAMGGTPRFCVVNLAVPAEYPVRDLTALQAGIVEAARQISATVVGGNLTRAEQLSVSIALLAEAPKRIITRRGARRGDQVYVTGTLGDAALGCRLLSSGNDTGASHAVRRFREPCPRLQAGRVLVGSGIAAAMIDVSDGLVQDLRHICEESAVGAVIRTSDVPVSPTYRRVCGSDATLALRGGEDYELLCTISRRDAKRLEAMQARLGCPITRIGEIVAGDAVRLIDANGRDVHLHAMGFDHFRSPV